MGGGITADYHSTGLSSVVSENFGEGGQTAMQDGQTAKTPGQKLTK